MRRANRVRAAALRPKKNMVPGCLNPAWRYTKSGIVQALPLSDRALKIDGTPTGAWQDASIIFPARGGISYTVTAKYTRNDGVTTGDVRVDARNAQGGTISIPFNGKAVLDANGIATATFSAPINTAYLEFFAQGNIAGGKYCIISDIMMIEGDTGAAWEPYQLANRTPKRLGAAKLYPGKNLCKPVTAWVNPYPSNANPIGLYGWRINQTTPYMSVRNPIKLTPGKTYTLSCQDLGGVSPTLYVSATKVDTTTDYYAVPSGYQKYVTFTVPATAVATSLDFHGASNLGESWVKGIMLEESSSPTAWAAYTETNKGAK